MEGTITKLVAGVYTIHTEVDEIVECKARGVFRNKGITPLVGDRVVLDNKDGDTVISKVLPRKNQFVRPAIANIDQMVILLAPQSPSPDLLMIDKLIISAQAADCEVVLCINKSDLSPDDAEGIAKQYENSGHTVLTVSVKENKGIDTIKELLRGKTTCFAGQSAVGKSSTLNALFPHIGAETGELSRKLDRGKHTTRHLEIFIFDDIRIADTPGFSLMDALNMEPEELAFYYEEMTSIEERCRFNGCIHKNEPNCAVKEQVGKTINEERYKRYLIILNELIEKRRSKYD